MHLDKMLMIGQPGDRGHGESLSCSYVYHFSEFTIIFQIKINKLKKEDLEVEDSRQRE